MTETTTLPNNLLVGNDRRLYVKKVVGPADAPLFTAIVPAGDQDLPKDRIAGESVDLSTFPKISMHNMIFVHAFFAEIYDKFKSEAIVLFHRDDVSGEYIVVVPESFSATAASLSYDHSQPKFCKTCRICSTQDIDVCPRCNTNTMVKTRVYGTAHSHGSMSAFHSGTDDAHEKNQTGFHITFGNVNQGLFSVCPSFVTALHGYTDKDGFGKRHYPRLEELVDLPDPLSQEEQAIIQLWTTTLFNEEIIRAFPNEQAVVLERKTDNTLVAVFASPNQDYAQHWCSLQPGGRDLQVVTALKVKEALSQQKSRQSSKAGWSTTSGLPQGGQAASARLVRTTTDSRTTQTANSGTSGTSGMLVSKKEANAMTTTSAATSTSAAGTTTSASEILTEDFLFSQKLPSAGIIVCLSEEECGDIIVVNDDGEVAEEWEVLDGLSMTSFADGVFGTWAVQYGLQLLVEAIDLIVPGKTSFFQKKYDDLVEELAKAISENGGGGSKDVSKELLCEYTIGKTAADVMIQRTVNRVISVADIPKTDVHDMTTAIAAQLYLVWAVSTLLEKASMLELLPDTSVDAINASGNKVIAELLDLYRKELATSVNV